MIAGDSGFGPVPQPVGDFRHAMAERYEMIIDFSKYPIGQRVVLQNLQPKNNIEFDNTDKVMAFDVVADASTLDGNTIPAQLNPGGATMALTEADAVRSRKFEFVRKHGQWTINGHTWADVIASGFTLLEAHPGFNDVEIWEFKNDQRRLVPPGAHPPDRLQDPRPQRASRRSPTRRRRRTSSTSARTRPCA